MFYKVYKGFAMIKPEEYRFETEEEAKAFYNEINVNHVYRFAVDRDPEMAKHCFIKTMTCVCDGYESFIDEERSR